MIARSAGRRPSPWGGLALLAATVVLCLLAAEAVSRLVDPAASLWRWPNLAVAAPMPAPGEAQFAYHPTLGWAPVAGSSATMLGRPLSFTAQATRAHNRDRQPPGGPSAGPSSDGSPAGPSTGLPAGDLPTGAAPAGPSAGPSTGPSTGAPIIAFGDSMTEGFGVGDDETWPAHLERLTGRPVLNAGVRGYGLDQMVLRAERMIPEIRPSMVILAFIADDISRTALAVRDARGKPWFVPEGSGLVLRNVPVQAADGSPPLTAARRLLGHSHLVDRIAARLGMRQAWRGSEAGTGADPFAVSCRLMERFAAVAKREGADALVVALPEQGVFRDAGAAAGQRAALTEVLGCAARAGLATLDTLPAFEAAKAGRDLGAYYAMMHFTDRGNALAARAIAAALDGDEGQRKHIRGRSLGPPVARVGRPWPRACMKSSRACTAARPEQESCRKQACRAGAGGQGHRRAQSSGDQPAVAVGTGEIEADDQVVVVAVAAAAAILPAPGIETVAPQMVDRLARDLLVGLGQGPERVAGVEIVELHRDQVAGIDVDERRLPVVAVARPLDRGVAG